MKVGDFVKDKTVGDVGWIREIRDGLISVFFDDGVLWMQPCAVELVSERR